VAACHLRDNLAVASVCCLPGIAVVVASFHCRPSHTLASAPCLSSLCLVSRSQSYSLSLSLSLSLSAPLRAYAGDECDPSNAHFRKSIGDTVAEVRRNHILEVMKRNGKVLSPEERVRLRNTSSSGSQRRVADAREQDPRHSSPSDARTVREHAQRTQKDHPLPSHVRVVER
jgi:hypothetical protein